MGASRRYVQEQTSDRSGQAWLSACLAQACLVHLFLCRFAMRRRSQVQGLLAVALFCLLALAPAIAHVGFEPDQQHSVYAQSQSQDLKPVGCDEGVACNSALMTVTLRVLLHTVKTVSWTPQYQSALLSFPAPGIVLPPPRHAA